MKRKAVTAEGLKEASRLIKEFFDRRPDLEDCRKEFTKAVRVIRESFQENGTLFLCGNGGSYADCLHISSEFMKSFERRRDLPASHVNALKDDPLGKDLAGELESGLRAIPLGLNGSLNSAVWNDKKRANIHFAQELYVLGDRGDVLLAISTSGNSKSVQYAIAVAQLLGIKVIGLTGPGGGQVAKLADVVLRLPGERTFLAQESHQALYHLLCRAIEAAFFPTPRE
jgi:D-sedoheptulose 7-phosphate isomerase